MKQFEIPEVVQEGLLEMGDWLKINGEAIYDTRPWILFGEGPTEVVEGHMTERQNADNTVEDIRFTQNENVLYAICLDVPDSREIAIRSLNPENGIRNDVVKSVELLGSEQAITWEIFDDQMMIQLQEIPDLKHAICFRIETKYEI